MLKGGPLPAVQQLSVDVNQPQKWRPQVPSWWRSTTPTLAAGSQSPYPPPRRPFDTKYPKSRASRSCWQCQIYRKEEVSEKPNLETPHCCVFEHPLQQQRRCCQGSRPRDTWDCIRSNIRRALLEGVRDSASASVGAIVLVLEM